MVNVGLRVMREVVREVAKNRVGENKNFIVRIYIDNKDIIRELTRINGLRTLSKEAAALRGLYQLRNKFFLLDRCPKYTYMEREELLVRYKHKNATNKWLREKYKRRKKKRTGE